MLPASENLTRQSKCLLKVNDQGRTELDLKVVVEEIETLAAEKKAQELAVAAEIVAAAKQIAAAEEAEAAENARRRSSFCVCC